MPKVKETRLRKGELASCCIETDFLHEKDGESGLWLEITGGKLDG